MPTDLSVELNHKALNQSSPFFLAKHRRISAQKSLEEHKPQIHVGSVASGSLVISDEGKKAELLELHGKLLGTEMEGAGLMHAAFFYGDSPRSAIVMKGVSDTADKKKSQLDALDFCPPQPPPCKPFLVDRAMRYFSGRENL